jgi:hypothetical protein
LPTIGKQEPVVEKNHNWEHGIKLDINPLENTIISEKEHLKSSKTYSGYVGPRFNHYIFEMPEVSHATVPLNNLRGN